MTHCRHGGHRRATLSNERQDRCGSHTRQKKPILEGRIIAEGHKFDLVGRNGARKSTPLKLIAGIGQILLQNGKA